MLLKVFNPVFKANVLWQLQMTTVTVNLKQFFFFFFSDFKIPVI